MSGTDDLLRSGRVLAVLFWTGVGLAPVAALILLLGQSGGPLRFAAILAVIAVVLIGTSIALRKDTESVKIEMQELLLDEIDQIRGDMRADITTASRNTYHALTEKIAELTEAVSALETQLHEAQAQPVVRTETVHVTRRTTSVEEAGGTVYGSRTANAVAPRGSHSDDRRDRDSRDRDSRDRDSRDRDSRDRDSRDREGYHDSGRTHRDSDYGDQRERPRERDYRESERRSDYREDDRDRSRSREPEPYRADSSRGWDGGEWDASGNRWASVRSDDRGRELRIGERRSEVRRDDRGGTEMRVEDRWAALRREDYGDADWYDRRDAPRALPAAPGEPVRNYTGDDRYRDREPEHDRYRDREPDRYRDDDWSAPRPRQGHSSEYDRDDRGWH